MCSIRANSIRPIAICIIYRGKDIFVFEGHDSIKGETFYRPLGGAIEFGECGSKAISREIYEEINMRILNINYLGVLENIFTYEGQPMHEIVLIYQAEFINPDIYNQEIVLGIEDNGDKFKAIWKPIEDFEKGKAVLYPEGLLRFISM
jgi:hypothetical protein